MLPQCTEIKVDDIYVNQIITTCLNEMSYYIESQGIAAVIDPMRDYSHYIKLAEERKAKIKFIFETHYHQDFVSGHYDLGKETGATIIFGPGAKMTHVIYIASEGEQFKLGKLKIKVMHTPGHTLESTSYILKKPDDSPYCVFTGDTLFIGEVGRPDLAIQTELNQDELAGCLYESLHRKLASLPDSVIVYPSHCAGSSCGKNILPGTATTIGDQKKTNYGLQIDMGKQEFVKILTTNLPKQHQYFFHDAQLNREGYENLEKIIEKGQTKLSLGQFLKYFEEEKMIIIDSRPPFEFITGYIKGSYNVNLVMNFGPWVGQLIPNESKLIIITEEGKEEEVAIRLARVGFNNIYGSLEGGLQTYVEAGLPLSKNEKIDAAEFPAVWIEKKPFILDVRTKKEYENEHIKGCMNIPLGEFESVLKKESTFLSQIGEFYVICKTGGRASIACAIMQKFGINQVTNVKGGMDALDKTKIDIEKI